jgi:predicted SnoaL-like aldol condensation-catalyzing enzyme
MTDPRSLIHRMHGVLVTRDVSVADEIFAPDFHSHPLNGGIETVKASWTKIMTAHPGVRTTIEDILVDGDRMAVRATVRGVNQEPATMLEIVRVADGRIAELWGASTLGLRD